MQPEAVVAAAARRTSMRVAGRATFTVDAPSVTGYSLVYAYHGANDSEVEIEAGEIVAGLLRHDDVAYVYEPGPGHGGPGRWVEDPIAGFDGVNAPVFTKESARPDHLMALISTAGELVGPRQELREQSVVRYSGTLPTRAVADIDAGAGHPLLLALKSIEAAGELDGIERLLIEITIRKGAFAEIEVVIPHAHGDVTLAVAYSGAAERFPATWPGLRVGMCLVR